MSRERTTGNHSWNSHRAGSNSSPHKLEWKDLVVKKGFGKSSKKRELCIFMLIKFWKIQRYRLRKQVEE